MGRAFFSQSYTSLVEPVVRTEPELGEVEKQNFATYEKWSAWNRFDPDSDEFFIDAEYEAFIDEREEGSFVVVEAGERMGSPVDSVGGSSDGSENENDAGEGQALSEASGMMPMAADTPPASPSALRRPVNIPPLTMPTEPSTPGLVSPVTDSPPHTPRGEGHFTAPSPPPSVTPRLYSWRHLPMQVPVSPTRGPLPNPSARRSLARITPVRITATV